MFIRTPIVPRPSLLFRVKKRAQSALIATQENRSQTKVCTKRERRFCFILPLTSVFHADAWDMFI